jgi:hypothetical protein
MSYTERFSETHYPLLNEPPDSLGPAATASSWVNVANYHRLIFVLHVGDMGQSGTIDAQLYQATDTSGTSAKVITGKSITQLTQAGGDGNEIVCIEVRTEELDVTNGFDCVKVLLTTGTAASEYSWILYGLVSRFEPVPTTNWAEIND